MSAWWEDLYDDLLADVLLERADAKETEDTLDFLCQRLDLSSGNRVMDQCCGTGSLAVPLALRGLRVCAVDQAAAYIQRAHARAKAAHAVVEWHTADAFQFTAVPLCDAVINWWTSFGYADDDDTNASMMHRAFESLVSGGRFALDVPNVAGVLRHFQPSVVTHRETPRGSVMLVRESRFNVLTSVMYKQWTYVLPDGKRVQHDSRVKHYTPAQLIAMLQAAGFVDVEAVGDIHGGPLTMDSTRCILLARRPK